MDVPLFYILKRGLEPEYFEAAVAALSITPCQAAFISDAKDAGLAWKLVEQVITCDSDETALSLAKKWSTDIGRPMLVIGKAEFLDSVFSDGHREAITADA